MLRLKNVSKYYYQDGVIASGFTKVNLELHLGEFVVITGESGSGKSTLLNVLSGLDSYEDGEMYINGEETSHYTEEDYLNYRRKYVSNIFQNFNLVNSYTVYQNIELTMLMNGKKRKDIKKYVYELIAKVGLNKYKHTLASKLSGGQKQRVAIARALANDTPIIVADEPTGSLDSESSKEILKLLHEISKDKLVIIVTHNKSEIEGYATRLIRMHDGKLLEDKIIKEVNLDSHLEEKKVSNITRLNKLRLGIRNTFNIPIKFTLMFIIFLLISITLITNYGGFKQSEYETNTLGYNNYFANNDSKRIIVTKNNKEPFTNRDYELISSLENVDYLVEDDLLLDYNIGFFSDNLYLSGTILNEDVNKVDVGKMPTSSNEIVVKGNPDNWYLSDMLSSLLEDKFTVDAFNGTKYAGKIKIVGIIYDNEANYYDELEFLLNEELLNDLTLSINERYNKVTYILNDNYFSLNNNMDYFGIKVSDNINSGEIYLSENFNIYCKDYNCLNNTFKIISENIYEKREETYKITNIFNSDNCKKILGINYEDASNYIFISRSDYNKLFNSSNYQSSIFIKEVKDLESTVNVLNNAGYNSLVMKDAQINDGATALQVIRILKLVATIILIIALFFISYFVIKIIYKSRNSYYTTLRTLGSTKSVCINILMKELFTIATITYSLFLIFIILVNKNILDFEYFRFITKYIEIKDYILVYLILILLSVLIANRYGKKVFKNSIIKTYGEKI